MRLDPRFKLSQGLKVPLSSDRSNAQDPDPILECDLQVYQFKRFEDCNYEHVGPAVLSSVLVRPATYPYGQRHLLKCHNYPVSKMTLVYQHKI